MKLAEAIEAIKKTGLGVTLSVEDTVALEIKVSQKNVDINVKRPELFGKFARKAGLL